MASLDPMGAELEAFMVSTFVGNCLFCSSAALLLYECITILPEVVEFIYKRKWTAVTVLFLSNYVCSLAFAVSTVIFIPSWTSFGSCAAVEIFNGVFLLLLSLVWAAFSALRVYAISNREWKCAVLVLLLSLVPFAANLYNIAIQTFAVGAMPPPIGDICIYTLPISEAADIRWVIAVRSCTIAADLIVLGVTWIHTYKIVREARRMDIRAPVMTHLLKDGTVYFMGLLLLNIAQIVTYLLINNFDLSFYITSFWAIIVSRFLLNLRRVAKSHEDGTGTSFVASRVSEIRFASSFIGPMGGPLAESFGISSHPGSDAAFADVNCGEEEGDMARADREWRGDVSEAAQDHVALHDLGGML